MAVVWDTGTAHISQVNDTWGKKVAAQVGGRMRPIESQAEVPHAKLIDVISRTGEGGV